MSGAWIVAVSLLVIVSVLMIVSFVIQARPEQPVGRRPALLAIRVVGVCAGVIGLIALLIAVLQSLNG
jgi:hypothetical protein